MVEKRVPRLVGKLSYPFSMVQFSRARKDILMYHLQTCMKATFIL